MEGETQAINPAPAAYQSVLRVAPPWLFQARGRPQDNLTRRTRLPFWQARQYGSAVSQSSSEHWSLSRSLAFLAATFAIMFGTLLPSAVAASAATGSPMILCSGDQILVVYDATGTPRPETPTPMDSVKCASCVLANFTALPPPPPPVHSGPAPRIVAVQPIVIGSRLPPPVQRTGLRPPPTAPPAA